MNGFAPHARAAIGWIVTVPPLALLACAAVIVAAAVVGLHPLWASQDLPLAAVAHAGDTAGVYRMLRRGVDPNRAGELVISSSPASLTPIEAAVESRQVETVQVLLRMGARIADADVPRLICLARASSAPEVETFLQATYHGAQAPDCSGMQLPPH